ncbi:unnamed protein product [Prorocentrum cordatum]|uniref:Uncharacterized protein n=1 Tax=Prorocentrum cordatum TaxID=2364126 RepID=A0ABN9XWK3_9DINO|nr:unnamed protein product [Polarella glacialis]
MLAQDALPAVATAGSPSGLAREAVFVAEVDGGERWQLTLGDALLAAERAARTAGGAHRGEQPRVPGRRALLELPLVERLGRGPGASGGSPAGRLGPAAPGRAPLQWEGATGHAWRQCEARVCWILSIVTGVRHLAEQRERLYQGRGLRREVPSRERALGHRALRAPARGRRPEDARAFASQAIARERLVAPCSAVARAGLAEQPSASIAREGLPGSGKGGLGRVPNGARVPPRRPAGARQDADAPARGESQKAPPGPDRAGPPEPRAGAGAGALRAPCELVASLHSGGRGFCIESSEDAAFWKHDLMRQVEALPGVEAVSMRLRFEGAGRATSLRLLTNRAEWIGPRRQGGVVVGLAQDDGGAGASGAGGEASEPEAQAELLARYPQAFCDAYASAVVRGATSAASEALEAAGVSAGAAGEAAEAAAEAAETAAEAAEAVAEAAEAAEEAAEEVAEAAEAAGEAAKAVAQGAEAAREAAEAAGEAAEAAGEAAEAAGEAAGATGDAA